MTTNDRRAVRELLLEFIDKCKFHGCPVCDAAMEYRRRRTLPDGRGEATYVCPRCKRRSRFRDKR